MADFARVDQVRVGTVLIPDGGFSCLDQDVPVSVEQDERGELFVRCRDGQHALAGQLDDGEVYIGFRLAPVSTFYWPRRLADDEISGRLHPEDWIADLLEPDGSIPHPCADGDLVEFLAMDLLGTFTLHVGIDGARHWIGEEPRGANDFMSDDEWENQGDLDDIIPGIVDDMRALGRQTEEHKVIARRHWKRAPIYRLVKARDDGAPPWRLEPVAFAEFPPLPEAAA